MPNFLELTNGYGTYLLKLSKISHSKTYIDTITMT